MELFDELNKIKEQKNVLIAQEQLLNNERKKQIANLAEQYGLLALPDEDIALAFQNISHHHRI